MLSSAADFKIQLLALPPVKDAVTGVTNFVNAVGNFMDLVQAGPNGTAGIFALDRPAMISILLTQKPVKDNSWIPNFANAWYVGCTGAIITPGTVTDASTWTSSITDIDTSPSATVTITTLTAAKALLITGLQSVSATPDAPLPLANAIRNATLAFKFECIGLAISVPSPIPVPELLSAE